MAITRAQLEALYTLNDGLDARAIARTQETLPFPLPDPYVEFLGISNGLHSGDRLVLLELEELGGRNRDYEVQDYLPGFVMIGDDSGGTALVMKQGEPTVFEVGMGVLDEEAMEVSAASLHQLLVAFRGKTLVQR